MLFKIKLPVPRASSERCTGKAFELAPNRIALGQASNRCIAGYVFNALNAIGPVLVKDNAVAGLAPPAAF